MAEDCTDKVRLLICSSNRSLVVMKVVWSQPALKLVVN